MHPQYSFLADLLSKFQSSPDWIKAMWLVAPTLTVVSVAYCVTQVLREVVRCRRAARLDVQGLHGAPEEPLLYGIYRNAQGELICIEAG